MIGMGVRSKRKDPGHPDTVEGRLFFIERIHFQTGHGQPLGQLRRRYINIHIISKPLQTDQHRGFSETLKLLEESHIVFKKETDIRDPEFQHRDPLQTKTKGKTGKFFRVIADVLEYLGINHARSQDLQPSALTADPASRTAADDSADSNL